MRSIAPVSLLVALLPCAACPAEIRGTVFGPKDEPLASVSVQIASAEWRAPAVATDNRGRYSVGDLRPGAYTVTARRAGFTQGRQAVRIAREEQVLGAPLRIQPWAQVPQSVTGTVLSEDGKTPVVGAAVVLYAGEWPGPGKRLKEATSDEEGFFAFTDVPAGA